MILLLFAIDCIPQKESEPQANEAASEARDQKLAETTKTLREDSEQNEDLEKKLKKEEGQKQEVEKKQHKTKRGMVLLSKLRIKRAW